MSANILPASFAWPDAVFYELVEEAPQLRRLQLYNKGRLTDKGLISPGRWGVPVSPRNVLDLGSKIDVLLFACRPKAVDISNPARVMTVYDPTDS